MLKPDWYIAEVVENDDSKSQDKQKLSRVKVRLLPEFEGITNADDLPWIRPFQVNTAQQFSVPEIGDIVIVVMLDDFYKTMFWQPILFRDSQVNTSTFTYDKSIQPILDKASPGQTYPNVHVERFKDGSIFFRNTARGDVGIVHNTGTTVCITNDGKVTIKDKDGRSLKKQLEDIKKVLDNIELAGNWVGNLGAPVIYKGVAQDKPVLDGLASSIAALYKE